jgi:hypothetical protein
MPTDQLLPELERQRKYLANLPSDFGFPLFNARYAVESQRKSGYRDTAAASREIVDNAIEAGADQIHVVFDIQRESKRELVKAIAFIDNGSGMLPEMARYALTWGGGTHFDEPTFIGKFGFGLPNASINQTRRTEVYTRTGKSEKFTKACLDLKQFTDFDQQSIPVPAPSALPTFVQKYLDRAGLNLDHGTVVVWVEPDRLTYRTAARLREHLVEDFGVTYRYLVKRVNRQIELVVEGTLVQPVDPLFLMPEGMLYLPPDPAGAVDRGGAQLILDRSIPVKYFTDSRTGEYHLEKIDDQSSLDPQDPHLVAAGAINVRFARFPLGFAEARPKDESVRRRFNIRKTRRGVTFVRAGREIETRDIFPRADKDASSGLGNWPLLQAYAYYWGMEVKFEPELDEVFGITNDKQAVRPIGDFWRILADEEIDALVRREYRWQVDQRKLRAMKQAQATEGPSPAELAARDADLATSTRPTLPERAKRQAQEKVEAEAGKIVGVTAHSIDEAYKAIQQEAKNRPYKVDYIDAEYGPFYKPEWIGSQIVVLINRKHPFYELFYAPLLELPGAYQAKEAADVLLLTLAKAELNADKDELGLIYEAQREQVWSPFLSTAMKSLKQKIQPQMEELAEEGEVNGEI